MRYSTAALFSLALTFACHPAAAGAPGLRLQPSADRTQTLSMLVPSNVPRPASIPRAAPLRVQASLNDPDAPIPDSALTDHEIDEMIADGASKILEGLKGPIEYPQGDRMLPGRMYDTETAADMYPAADLDFTTEPKSVPRPYEIETPRERDARDAQQQVDELFRDEPETEVASAADHGERRVT